MAKKPVKKQTKPQGDAQKVARPQIQMVPLEKIQQTVEYKVREPDQGTVKGYAETMKAYLEEYEIGEKEGTQGAKPEFPFPPLKVIELEDGTYECIGGNHTLQAAKKAGLKEIKVIVIGEDEDPILVAIQDNCSHGRPYAKNEKYEIARRLHKKGMSLRKIASMLGVSKSTVENIVKAEEVSSSGQNADKPPKPFDPEKHLKKFRKPFDKDPDLVTPKLIGGLQEMVEELQANLIPSEDDRDENASETNVDEDYEEFEEEFDEDSEQDEDMEEGFEGEDFDEDAPELGEDEEWVYVEIEEEVEVDEDDEDDIEDIHDNTPGFVDDDEWDEDMEEEFEG